jgi:hypothetical protein
MRQAEEPSEAIVEGKATNCSVAVSQPTDDRDADALPELYFCHGSGDWN